MGGHRQKAYVIAKLSLSQTASDEGGGFKFRAHGGVACASYEGKISGAYGRVNAPFTVPEWARPAESVAGAIANQTAGAPGYIIAQADGTIGAQAWGTASSSDWIGAICWPVR